MKKHFVLTAAVAALASTAFAGQPVAPSKDYIAPEPVYGTGFYIGLQGGVNIAQDYGSKNTTIGNTDLSVDFGDNTGWIAGLKAGYVFGTGLFRPALELDGFYNGFTADAAFKINGREFAHADADINSGAMLLNALLRINLNRFQPYVGIGGGGYYASVSDVDLEIGGRHFAGEGGDTWGWAWQAIGGADVYVTERVSVFGEYKFLSYENVDLGDDRVTQHIAVAGVRWHF